MVARLGWPARQPPGSGWPARWLPDPEGPTQAVRPTRPGRPGGRPPAETTRRAARPRRPGSMLPAQMALLGRTARFRQAGGAAGRDDRRPTWRLSRPAQPRQSAQLRQASSRTSGQPDSGRQAAGRATGPAQAAGRTGGPAQAAGRTGGPAQAGGRGRAGGRPGGLPGMVACDFGGAAAEPRRRSASLRARARRRSSRTAAHALRRATRCPRPSSRCSRPSSAHRVVRTVPSVSRPAASGTAYGAWLQRYVSVLPAGDRRVKVRESRCGEAHFGLRRIRHCAAPASQAAEVVLPSRASTACLYRRPAR